MSLDHNGCTVSVVIPTFNCAWCLPKAIQSILEQGIADLEILVINDGSTDDTSEVLQQFASDSRVKVLTHPGGVNKGVCSSRRLGIERARGEFIAFLDADDSYLPNKLRRHLAVFRDEPKVILVHGSITFDRQSDQSGHAWACSMGDQPQTYDLTRQSIFLRRNVIANSTVVCRRSAIFPDDLPEDMVVPSEDWVIWNSMSARGLFHFDPEVLTAVLVRDDSFTSRMQRPPGITEMRAIEFYVSVISRLPRLTMRLRAIAGLVYYLHKLIRVRSALSAKPGFVSRTVQWFFDRVAGSRTK